MKGIMDQLGADMQTTKIDISNVTQQQIAAMAIQIDTLRTGATRSHDDLRKHIAALADAPSRNKANLLGLKKWEPDHFSGLKSEDYRWWAKTVKHWADGRIDGMRDALDWAVKEEGTIDQGSRTLVNWEPIERANVMLYGFLCMACKGEALSIVEAHTKEGFEAWRKLAKRYDPKGGIMDVNRIQTMYKRKQCKHLEELPAAIDAIMKDLRYYDARGTGTFPDDLKMGLLLQVLPDSHKDYLETHYTMNKELNARAFHTAVEEITAYANLKRVQAIRERGPASMDVDSTTWEETRYTAAEWAECNI